MKFFLLFLLSSSVFAEADLRSLVKAFGMGSPEVLVPYCAPEEALPGDLLESDFVKTGFIKVPCPDPWDDRTFYWQVHDKYCRARFGATGFTCVENDPAKIEARASNAPLLDEMKKFTVKRFAEYKEKLVSQCCGDKAKCTKRFNNVKLIIVPGNKVSAEYLSDTDHLPLAVNNSIAITEGKLAAAYNTENIERVLLVELAHACQFAVVSENPEEFKTFTSPYTRCDKDSGLLQFKESLGAEVSQCLIDELEAQMKEIPEDQKKNYCFGKWYREAFSDMKFRSEFSNPYHWTFDMGRRSNAKNYASVFKYIRCAFPADWKQKMCL